MEKYFSMVDPARSLQERFIREVGVDIIARVKDVLHETSGLPVRLARQGDKEYFAGILRVVEGNFIAPHADFGPFVCPPPPFFPLFPTPTSPKDDAERSFLFCSVCVFD